ncbi:hypothetical protein J8F10_13150 [Gemmata sp. G18]|uniref:DUF1570 domain-containing protein n=1 Tax=Gemmata palustris TaxID=2822762 RepID=A0ABS5BR77_9BACT|nr:hypothetical protein [Gemmata palustris]MBP3956230.1 hypothetical protein [Gemmata palustris]
MARYILQWTSVMAIVMTFGSADALGQPPSQAKLPEATAEMAIKIDPALISQLDQVWTVIGSPKNPVWPGWDARDTPVLIYFPDRQDVLINHPKPPEGFKRYTGPLKSALGPIHIRDGKTITSFDGQNTAIDVGGVQTLVVADTLSARRQWAESVAAAAKGDPANAKAQIDSGLVPNPYPAFRLFAHEAFHVYQHKRAPGKAPRETALLAYPSLSVENNVGFALEAEFLHAALEAEGKDAAVPHLKKWLAARSMRRANLSQEAIDYEDATEFSEGTAVYVEYRLTQCLEGTAPLDKLWLIQGFQGFKDLSSERAGMRARMRGMMSGRVPVNNDLYGASPVRFRLYFSGMAIAASLDRLGARWHDKVFDPTVTLTGLLSAELKVKPEELGAEVKGIRAGAPFADLTRQKTALENDGKAHIAAAVAAFDRAAGELVIDYARVRKPAVGFVYTSFGILRVADHQSLYRLIPISGTVGAFKFAEDAARPVFHDAEAKRIRVQLTGKPDPADLAKQIGAELTADRHIDLAKLTVPGVTLNGVKGTVRLDGKRLTLVLDE